MPPTRSRVGRGAFVALLVALLAAGLLGLLGLNTLLAQGSFRLHALQVQNKQLADREQVLRRDVEARQAPAALAAQAQTMGMVPGGPPAFLRLPDGAVLGDPKPATAPPAPPPAQTQAPTGRAATGQAPPAADGALPVPPNADLPVDPAASPPTGAASPSTGAASPGAPSPGTRQGAR